MAFPEVKTSVGYETAPETLARATALLTKGNNNTPVADPAVPVFDYTPPVDVNDKIINNLKIEAGNTATNPINEEEIRRRVLRTFQKEIDATNNIYDNLVNEQKTVNANNEGGLRAIQNRQGLVGSQRGFTQTQEQRDQGQQAIGAINAERSAKIGSILGTARQDALDEITARRQAKQNGASAYLSYVELEDQRRNTRLANVINALVTQGVDPNELSPQEISDLARNIGVDKDQIFSEYSTATADARAAETASTREGAIVSLINQGVADPKQIYDYLNYDEQGNKIGDISLEEITAVTKALETNPDAFNLSQGQARYVKQPDGTYVQVAYNPKTYAPTGDGSTGSGGSSVPSFESWAATIANDSEIGGAMQAKQKELGRVLTADESWAVMRDQYKQTYGVDAPQRTSQEYYTAVEAIKAGGGEVFTPDKLNNLTPTNKRDLQQAGLESADALAQSYFLNTDSAFRDYFSRLVASGEIPANATLDQVDEAYTNWYNEKEGGSSSDPFANMSTAEMLQMLSE